MGADIAAVVLYFAAVGLLGYFGVKGVGSFADYAVAGRSVGTWVLFATIAATCIGGGCTTGFTGYGFSFGYIIAWAVAIFSVSYALVALFIAPRMRETGFVTVSDLFGHAYGKSGRLLSSVIGFLWLIQGVGLQFLAGGRILEVFFGVPLQWATVLVAAVVILYTTLGGMLAVIYTDVIQFLVLAICVPLLTLRGLGAAGGWQAVAEKVPASHFAVTSDWAAPAALGLFLALAFGETLVPSYSHRFYSAKTPQGARNATLLFAGVVCCYTFIVATNGLIGRALLPADTVPDQVMATLIKMLMPAGLRGLLACGVIAAVMSTADSGMNAAATIAGRDWAQKLLGVENDRQLLRVAKIVCLLIGLFGLASALWMQGIMKMLLFAYDLWAPTIIVPLVLGLLWRRSGRPAASPYCGFWSMVAGLAGCFGWKRAGLETLLPGIFVGLVACLVVYLVVHALTYRMKPGNWFAPDWQRESKTEIGG
ncbi:MAG: sodium:solute symporter family protein [Bacillota bacterium]